MGEFVRYLDVPRWRSVACHKVVGNVDYEIYLNGLLYAIFPVTHEQSVTFAQLILVSAHEETGDVVVVLGGVEGFEIDKIFLDDWHLFFSELALNLVLFLLGFNLLWFMAVAFGSEGLEGEQ